jgi:hypothetical protein
MLQELAARTGASAWAIASMLFFLAVWVAITVRVFTARRDDLDARARLALEGDECAPSLKVWGAEGGTVRGDDPGPVGGDEGSARSSSERRAVRAGRAEA